MLEGAGPPAPGIRPPSPARSVPAPPPHQAFPAELTESVVPGFDSLPAGTGRRRNRPAGGLSPGRRWHRDWRPCCRSVERSSGGGGCRRRRCRPPCGTGRTANAAPLRIRQCRCPADRLSRSAGCSHPGSSAHDLLHSTSRATSRTTVRAGMLMPRARVSVAKTTFRNPAAKRSSTVSLKAGTMPA